MTVPGGQTIGVVCLLFAFIAVAMCVTVVTVYISRWSKKRHSSEAAPNTQELDVAYEEVDTLQSQTIRLERNVAYVSVKQKPQDWNERECGIWTSETKLMKPILKLRTCRH